MLPTASSVIPLSRSPPSLERISGTTALVTKAGDGSFSVEAYICSRGCTVKFVRAGRLRLCRLSVILMVCAAFQSRKKLKS